MKCIEIIELRTAQKDQVILKQYLASLLAQANTDQKAQSIKIYKHVCVETDFSIHLQYDSEIDGKEFRVLGERLESALKEFGLVNHKIWVEQDLKEK